MKNSAYKNETELVAAIRLYLALRQAVTIRINSGMTVIGEGDTRRVFRGAEAGTSDILACVRGIFVAIEAKMPGNVPTAAQERFLESVREAGGLAFVATCLEDVDAGLDWAPYYT